TTSQRTGTPLAELVLSLARAVFPCTRPQLASPPQRFVSPSTASHATHRAQTKAWAQYRDATLRELAARGHSLNAITKHLGVHWRTVRHHLTRMEQTSL